MNWESIVGDVGSDQYGDRIATLQDLGIETSQIEKTVSETIESLDKGEGRSFVIFGEPQSGKTEMMIALNAKLLDKGEGVIVNLVTDSVDLLNQSLARFRDSGLSPSPKQYSELPHKASELKGKKWLVFSKKNARDLEKLIELLRHSERLVVIDDEADYASPNAKVNKDEKTKINQLICDLLGDKGQYIGVTATPARLNLNNTFENDSELWVDFPPHGHYVGQDYFFPSDGEVNYRLHTFNSEEGNEKAELETAVINFLCGVAELHQHGVKRNFTMLVHTSGKRTEHGDDVDIIRTVLSNLSNPKSGSFERLIKKLLKEANDYGNPEEIVSFVLRNINRHQVVEINSNGSSGSVADIAKPTSLFSFGAGGNIISRGVTFDNLLSMYFTRSVKGKFSQDTYIQRARMFGTRNLYKDRFQLWIPYQLMANWSKCFELHKLALQAMKSGNGAPVWLSDHKTTPTSPASIDRSSVDFEDGEMSFGMFRYAASFHPGLFEREGRGNLEILEAIRGAFSEEEFPNYIFNYIKRDIVKNNMDIGLHPPSLFGSAGSSYTKDERKSIRRNKGVFGNLQRADHPDARHHLKIFFNDEGNGRIFYKLNGGSIRFIQNRR